MAREAWWLACSLVASCDQGGLVASMWPGSSKPPSAVHLQVLMRRQSGGVFLLESLSISMLYLEDYSGTSSLNNNNTMHLGCLFKKGNTPL